MSSGGESRFGVVGVEEAGGEGEEVGEGDFLALSSLFLPFRDLTSVLCFLRSGGVMSAVEFLGSKLEVATPKLNRVVGGQVSIAECASRVVCVGGSVSSGGVGCCCGVCVLLP